MTDREKELELLLIDLSAVQQESQHNTEYRLKQLEQRLEALQAELDGLLKLAKFSLFSLGEGTVLVDIQRALSEKFGLERFCMDVRAIHGGTILGVDMLGYSNSLNGKVFMIALIYHLEVEHIEQIVQVLELFPQFFSEHADKKLYGMVATFIADEEAYQQAIDAGLYVGKVVDKKFHLALPPDFTPLCFAVPLIATDKFVLPIHRVLQ